MEKELLYQIIFKRKSFHLFKDTLPITPVELKDIEEAYQTFTPLVSNQDSPENRIGQRHVL